MILIIGLGVLVAAALIAVGWYAAVNFYEARTDRTFMTHDEGGFRRALKGKGVLWDYEETIVKGPHAPHVAFVALDPATGGRRTVKLMDAKSGSINLRPQYCVPLPFSATTLDGHKFLVEARVQFSLNRDLLKYVYQLEDFGMALETRIQSAFRSEIGRRHDEELRSSLHDVETAVVEHLRRAEREGDEIGEPGVALGVNFHTVGFTYTEAEDVHGMPIPGVGAGPMLTPALHMPEAGSPAAMERVRAAVRTQGVLSLRPQQLDQLADVFKNRDAASTKAILALLEMQTRQNIAEVIASSSNLVVLTAEELGFTGASTQRDRVARLLEGADTPAVGAPPPKPNGAPAAPPAQRV